MMAWISPKVIAVICTHVFHWKGDKQGSYVLMPTGLSKMACWSVSMVHLYLLTDNREPHSQQLELQIPVIAEISIHLSTVLFYALVAFYIVIYCSTLHIAFT